MTRGSEQVVNRRVIKSTCKWRSRDSIRQDGRQTPRDGYNRSTYSISCP